MNTSPNLAAIGALIGHPTRAVILETLIDGRSWTAGELARQAGVTPQTASSHLHRLVEGGLLKVDARGRCRYFSLAGYDVADALEALEVLGTRRAARPGLVSARSEPLIEARTCYDHLAGRLGVGLVKAMKNMQYIREHDDSYSITSMGTTFISDLAIDIGEARNRRRAFARKCFDWSEQQYHLGGALGAALAERLFELRWLRKAPKSRAVTVTSLGSRHLHKLGLIETK
ncbi:MAG: transcriptional regulator [marine bacterium B5-7]|nr:MAG: transcriptional regulator [marine bacterium B5-7]